MNNFIKYINPYRNIWQFLAANLIFSMVLLPLFYDGWNQSFKHFSLSLIWAFTIFITQWAGHVYINNKLSERFPWQDNAYKRAIYGFLGIIFYAVIAYLLVQFMMMRLINGSLPKDPFQWALKSSVIAISVSFFVSLVFTTIGFFKAWKKSLLEAEQYKTQMLAYKYEALQNQINPHFLFNSFNVLSDLVYEDQKKATQFIKQMSQLFRYVLDNREKELVELSDEIEFLKAYIFLLQTRFENKLTINLNVTIENDDLIVPMALQILVENCVKHNEISSLKTLIVDIVRHDGVLEIRNNLQLKNVDEATKKTGLTNIKQQYSFFTDREVEIEQSDDYYLVRIPILKKIKE